MMTSTSRLDYSGCKAFYYLDEDLLNAGLGVFNLLPPKMQNVTLELCKFTKTSRLKRMAASTSEGGVPCATPSSVTKKKAKKKAVALPYKEDQKSLDNKRTHVLTNNYLLILAHVSTDRFLPVIVLLLLAHVLADRFLPFSPCSIRHSDWQRALCSYAPHLS